MSARKLARDARAPAGQPLGKGREIGSSLIIAIFFTIQSFPLDNAKDLSPEEMAGYSSSRCLLRLLRMSLARALHFFLRGKKDCTFYRTCHFGRGVILAGSSHPGTGGDGQISRLQLAKTAHLMAEKDGRKDQIKEQLMGIHAP